MLPAVKVTWLDACSASGWRTEPSPPSANFTLGYLVHEDDDFVEVACTYDPASGCWNGSISIPRDNIIFFRTIEEDTVEITFESE